MPKKCSRTTYEVPREKQLRANSNLFNGIKSMRAYKDIIFNTSYNMHKLILTPLWILNSHQENVSFAAESCSCVRKASRRSCVELYKKGALYLPFPTSEYIATTIFSLQVFE
jgi:hypothetical protein